MDLVTALVAYGIAPLFARVATDIWTDWREKGRDHRGMLISPSGQTQELLNVSNALALPAASPPAQANYGEPPLMVAGSFFGEEFLDDVLVGDETVLLLAFDEDHQELYLFEFDLDGYAISLWPGNYSFYAIIVDPVLDEEILGVGYPALDSLDDPNPISLSGYGHIGLDILIFDTF